MATTPIRSRAVPLGKRLTSLVEELVVVGEPLTLRMVTERASSEPPSPSASEVRKEFGRGLLKKKWVIALTDDVDSPIYRLEELQQIAADPTLITQLVERGCTADKPLQPLKELVKPVHKLLGSNLLSYWPSHVEELPSGIVGTLKTTAGKNPKSTLSLHPTKYPLPDEALSHELLALLTRTASQKPDSYPTTLHELVQGKTYSEALIKAAILKKPFVSQTQPTFAKLPKGRVQLYGLLEEQDTLAGNLRIFDEIFSLYQTGKAANDDCISLESLAATAKKWLDPRIAADFGKQLESAVQHNRLPAALSSLRVGGKVILFYWKTLGINPGQAKASPLTSDAKHTTKDFANDFKVVFEKLFRAGGNLASVKLSDLRSRLKQYSRDEFDRGLNALRIGRQFTLETNEGQRNSLSYEDQNSGITETGQRFYFCRRI